MEGCVYPRCYSCKLPYCTKDDDKPKPKKDRSEYYKNWYKNHAEERKANYQEKKQYVRWTEVKKTLNGLKKQIGLNNFELIMGEIEKLDRHTTSNMLRNENICHQNQVFETVVRKLS